ncbi:hypothetical protein [Nostoc sp. DSM 114161]
MSTTIYAYALPSSLIKSSAIAQATQIKLTTSYGYLLFVLADL